MLELSRYDAADLGTTMLAATTLSMLPKEQSLRSGRRHPRKLQTIHLSFALDGTHPNISMKVNISLSDIYRRVGTSDNYVDTPLARRINCAMPATFVKIPRVTSKCILP